MNKIKMLFCAMLIISFAKSQDIEEINDLASKMKFGDAKTAVDKYLAKKNNAKDAEAWFLKGYIYNNLSHDSTTTSAESFSLKTDAFEAYKRNQELDAKDIQLTLQQHIPYLDLYFEFINLGVKYFNAKQFNEAVASFKKANEVKDYTLLKKYKYDQVTLYPLDTSLIKNIAITSIQANNEDEAMKSYKLLADANVAGSENMDIYTFLIDYFHKKNQNDQVEVYLSKGRSLYPKNDYWNEFEIKAVKELSDPEKLFAKYEDLMQKNPGNFYISYNYAVELFNHLKSIETLTDNDIIQFDKLTEVLKVTIQNEDNSDVSAMVLMSNHLYRYAFLLQNSLKKFKIVKPEDNKKKSDLKNKLNSVTDNCISYSEKAVGFYENLPNKTVMQGANYGIILEFLIDIYGSKNDKAKVDLYTKKKAKAK